MDFESSKPAWFEPEFVTDDHVSPLALKHIEFDWEVLRRNLREAKEEMTETDYKLLANVMGELLAWITRGSNLKIIGRRAVALAWVTNPEIFKGKSAAKVAAMMGCHKQRLSDMCGEASRKFRIRNRAQDHAGNFNADK